MNKIILDLCGGTGAWSKPYKDSGYDVEVVTLPWIDIKNYMPPDNVYGILAAPPCTHFSHARTNAKEPRDLKGGLELVIACLNIIWKCQYEIKKDTQMKPPLKFWALENPDAMLNWFLGSPAFIFHPYEFGENYSKKTCLWGHFNKPLVNPISKESPLFKKQIKNLSDIESKNLHSEFHGILTRKVRRAITPKGFAAAFFKANK